MTCEDLTHFSWLPLGLKIITSFETQIQTETNSISEHGWRVTEWSINVVAKLQSEGKHGGTIPLQR